MQNMQNIPLISQAQPSLLLEPAQELETQQLHNPAENALIGSLEPIEQKQQMDEKRPRLEYSRLSQWLPAEPWQLLPLQHPNIGDCIRAEQQIHDDIRKSIALYDDLRSQFTDKHVDFQSDMFKSQMKEYYYCDGKPDNIRRIQTRLCLQHKCAVTETVANDLEAKHRCDNAIPLKDMFGSDGIARLPTKPWFDANVRPIDSNDISKRIEYRTIRMPSLPSHPTAPPYSLRIHLSHIEFNDFPLFTVEDLLVKSIVSQYHTYIDYKTKKEEISRDIPRVKKHFNANISSKKRKTDECISLLEEILELRRKEHEHSSMMLNTFRNLYSNWRNLQSWRHDHGQYAMGSLIESIYIGSALQLTLEECKMDADMEANERNKSIEAEISEMEQLINLRKEKTNNRNPKDTSLNFDRKACEQQIRERIDTHLQKCGASFYEPYLTQSEQFITSADVCSAKERFRRRLAQNKSIVARVIVDGKYVTKSNGITLNFPQFICDLQFEVELKLLTLPERVTIELRYGEWFGSQIALFDLPTDIFKHSDSIQSHTFDFVSATAITTNPYLTLSEYNAYVKPTHGDWDRSTNGKIYTTLQFQQFIQTQPNIQSTTTTDCTESDMKEEPEEKKEDLPPQTISEDSIPPELLLVTPLAKQEENLEYLHYRPQILELRKKYAVTADEVIPLIDDDIPEHLYQTVAQQSNNEVRRKNEMIFERMQHSRIDVSEVVREYVVPTVDWLSIDWWIKPHRRLRPHRQLYAQSAINPETCRLIVQILQCRNLPIRKHTQTQTFNQSQNQSNQQSHNGVVHPYVEIEFLGNTVRTKSSFGAHPRWEQTCVVPFTPPGGVYTPSSLQSIKDNIVINLYDEVIVSKGMDERTENTKLQRTEKRWLGTTVVPFTTVYFNNFIEGYFEVETPLIHIGYQKTNLLGSEPSLLWLFATLDPPMALPPKYKDNSEWIAQYPFYQWVEHWCRQLHKDNLNISSSRSFHNIYVADSQNCPTLVCKYLRPLEPPKEAFLSLTYGITPDQIFTRFVACIPFAEDVHTIPIPGATDVWTTISEFLTMGSGDWEEHALLLASYFLWYDEQNPTLGWQTFIAVGTGIPSGDTVYVLRRNVVLNPSGTHIQAVTLYNACTGIFYAVPESSGGTHHCPLTDISFVFTQTQLWANVQSDLHPSSENFSFQFEDSSKWKPLFSKNSKFSADDYALPSIQEHALSYIPIQPEYLKTRQEKLEYIIEEQFDSWRKLPTRWNYAICKTLREALLSLEPMCQNGGKIPSIPDNPQISAIQRVYPNMYGFPLHLTDNGSNELIKQSDDNPAVSLVFNTKVHQNEDRNAEFARAVYIYPYTNNIVSVWIYIASISRS